MGTAVIAATEGQGARGVADVAILQSQQVAVARDEAGDVVVGQAHEVALLIDDLDGEDGKRPIPLPLPVREGSNMLLFDAQGIRAAGGADFVEGSLFPRSPLQGGSFGAQCAGLVGDVPIADVGG